MDFPRSFLLLLLILTAVLMRSDAHEFLVGGKDGWVQHPSEGYNHWAGRNRFQVNDTLYFKYDKGNDSVLIVSRKDYYACSTINPIQSLSDGNSIFKFARSGPFFFISGIADHCNADQRLIVVVLAIRPPAPAARAPSPALAPTVIPTPSGSPSVAAVPSGSETAAPAPSSWSSGSSKLSSALVGVMVMSVGYVIGGGLIIF